MRNQQHFHKTALMPKTLDPNLTSVIIVVRHASPALDKTIEAVLAQTSPVELVIVNNASSELEKRLKAKNNPRIVMIEGHKNIGMGEGNNLGARAANGAWYLFLCEDVTLPKDAVAKLREEASKLKASGVLGVKLIDDKGAEKPESRRQILTPEIAYVKVLCLSQFLPKYKLSLVGEPPPLQTTVMPAVSGACLFMPARNFVLARGFDNKSLYGIEDMDFFLRIQRVERQVFFVPNITATQRQPLASPSGNDLKAIARSFARYFYENFGYPQPILWLLDILITMRLTAGHVLRKLVK
jgi:N-acetylglucosaminyl-diphospho-decaprenol L-rhamnosyltransferase